MTFLPPVPSVRSEVEDWVAEHLGDLICDTPVGSPKFVGGQKSADEALSQLDVTGYARSRSMVWPPSARGASMMSPYIRHGLLTLPEVWNATSEAPSHDRFRYQGELLWQEYSRHWYALFGRKTSTPLSYGPAVSKSEWPHPALWDEMECVRRVKSELETDGWMVNQTRMWMASQWSVRAGRDQFEGESYMFRHLLDGSRAANRMGWQWASGTLRGRAGGFARQQVQKRAPQFCRSCSLSEQCPVGGYARTITGDKLVAPEMPNPMQVFGPTDVLKRSVEPERVWITAESLGSADPALSAYPDLPVVFVFDDPLLRKLQLSGKRLVFLAECLASIQSRRDLCVVRGNPAGVVGEIPTAVTFAPVPGFSRIAKHQPGLEIHPWPWLRPLTPLMYEHVLEERSMPTFKEWCQLTKPVARHL